MNEFGNLWKKVSPGKLSELALSRYMQNLSIGETKEILRKYAARPLAMVMKAHREDEGKIYGLALRIDSKEESNGFGPPKIIEPYFEVNDLMVFIKNAETIVEEYNRAKI